MLLQMSLTGGLLILLVALIRQLSRGRMPKTLFPLLWGVVLVRLLIPFPALFPVSVPLPAALTAPAGISRQTLDPLVTPTPPPGYGAGEEEALPAYLEGSAAELSRAKAAPSLLTLLWLGGAGLTGLVFLSLYARGQRRFRQASDLTGEGERAWLRAHPLRRKLSLRSLGGLGSPLTYGLLRPVILLPEGLDAASLEGDLALEHEFTHVRRLDGLWKLLFTLALVLHWFNPAAWLMWVLANRDLELSCDEAVLNRLGGDRRRDYAQALVSLEERRSRMFTLSFGGGAAAARIQAIMGFRRAGALRRGLSAALLVCLCLCALGSLRVRAGLEGKVYRNGGLTLTVPGELADLVLVQTPQLSPEQRDPEGDVVFRVVEREAWLQGQEKHPGVEGWEGLLFIILREPEDRALEAWTRKAYSHELLARRGHGECYSIIMSTFSPPTLDYTGLDSRSERYARWLKVHGWKSELWDSFSRDNPDLTVYHGPGAMRVANFLSEALYGDGETRYTLRLGEEGQPYDLMSCPQAEDYAWELIWQTRAEYVGYAAEPEGTPLILSAEEDALYFWRGSEWAFVQRWSDYSESYNTDYWLTGFLDGREGTLSDLIWDWYAALVRAGG